MKTAVSTFVIAALLNGCANQAAIEPATSFDWQQHQVQIAQLQNWVCRANWGLKMPAREAALTSVGSRINSSIQSHLAVPLEQAVH